MVRARGFTLIELVVVILLLGVMATFTSQFISTGTQLYADASAREQLMSDVRFGVERLNREVRDADWKLLPIAFVRPAPIPILSASISISSNSRN